MIKDPAYVLFKSFELNYTALPELYPLLSSTEKVLQPAVYSHVYNDVFYSAILIPLAAGQEIEQPAHLIQTDVDTQNPCRVKTLFLCSLMVNSFTPRAIISRLGMIKFSVAAPAGFFLGDQIRLTIEISTPDPHGNVGKVVMDADMLPTGPDR